MRRAARAESGLDDVIALLFLLARAQPDRVDLLRRLDTRWVRRDTAQGTAVDVLVAPAVIPEREASRDDSGDAGYWIDADGGLRKIEARLGTDMPVTLELLRDERVHFAAVDALGGRDITPQPVTDAEAELLALLRPRNHHARRARVTLTLPALPGTLRVGHGWLDWRRSLIYLSVRDLDAPQHDVIVHADRAGRAWHRPGVPVPQTPPLPPPSGGWERSPWAQAQTDLDVLLHETLALGVDQADDVSDMKVSARRLRYDKLHGTPVGVFELPLSGEARRPAGTARLRYWLDNTGVLRRLEVRTQTGGLAQLDLAMGGDHPPVPSSVQ